MVVGTIGLTHILLLVADMFQSEKGKMIMKRYIDIMEDAAEAFRRKGITSIRLGKNENSTLAFPIKERIIELKVSSVGVERREKKLRVSGTANGEKIQLWFPYGKEYYKAEQEETFNRMGLRRLCERLTTKAE